MTNINGTSRPRFKKNYAIVGLDPGITFGVAALDFLMNPLYLKSYKSISSGQLIKDLSLRCSPVLFTCDVDKSPAIFKKIAASFNSNIFLPEKKLSVQEKHSLVKQYLKTRHYLKQLLDEHSFDALAAVLKTYKHFKNRFSKVDALYNNFMSEELKNRIKIEILKGQTITKAFRNILFQQVEYVDNKKIFAPMKVMESDKELKSLKDILQYSQNTIDQLKKDNSYLIKKMKKLETEKNQLSSVLLQQKHEAYKELDKDLIYMQLKTEISSLRKRLKEQELKNESLTSSIRRLRMIKTIGKAGGLILIKPIETFSQKGIDLAIKQTDIKQGDPLLIHNAAGGGSSTAQSLVKLNPKFIILCTGISHQAERVLVDNRIPLFSSDEVNLKYIEEIPAVYESEIKEKIRQYQK